MTGVRARVAQIPPIAAVAAIAGGGLVLAAWAFDIVWLTQPMANASSMRPSTAGSFIAVGASLWLYAKTRFTTAAAVLGALVGVVGLLSLGHLVFGQEFRFDRLWLASDAPFSRMSPLTATDFLLIGLALAIAARSSRAWLVHCLILAAVLVATIVSIGYAYEVTKLIGFGGYTTMAPHTAVLLLIVCAGIMFLHADHGVMAVFTSDTLGGKMARQILPATILVPIGLGWLRLKGERLGWYDPHVGPPFLIVGTMILLSFVVWLNARTLARVDGKRQEVEDALRRSNESLEARVTEKTAQLAESRAAAAESAEMFFQLFEFAPDALVAVDANGRIDRANIRALELFGYERTQLLGHPAEILLPDRLAAQFLEHRDSFLRAPHARNLGADLQLAARRKDGSEFPAEIVVSPADSPRGPLVLAVVHDLTERRRAETLTRAAEERIQTGQRMEALGQLAGGVAHDFNNMMTVVTGYSELLLARPGNDAAVRKGLQQIRKAGERCANLTGHLLAFSRRQVLTPSILDLGSVVADLNQMMPVLLGENIAVTVTIDPDLWQVRADQAQIEQVIVNLVVNARDAMPRGGTLGISARNRLADADMASTHPEMAPGQYVVLSIADNGHGMDEKTRARVFDPFFTTKPVGQGSGLGLSTAYGFIKQSGGYIYLASELDRGTTVDVYVPRAESTPATVSKPTVRTMPGGDETILLAEDESTVRAFVHDVLGHAGYQLLEASDGPSALKSAEAHGGPIHLLISDIVMPGMSGDELAERLSASRPDIQILLMSGYSQHRVVERAASESAAPFLFKPFTADELLSRVREILDARESA